MIALSRARRPTCPGASAYCPVRYTPNRHFARRAAHTRRAPAIMPANLTDSLSVEVTGSRQRKRPECFAAYEQEGSDDEDGRRRPKKSRPPTAHDGEGGKKRMRCGACDGCQKPNCGKCSNCKDMPKFGGKGTKRQTCEERLCEVHAPQGPGRRAATRSVQARIQAVPLYTPGAERGQGEGRDGACGRARRRGRGAREGA